MGDDLGLQWLRLEADGDEWRLPVTESVISGASALFGGCATAAALLVAQQVAPQPVVWAAAHFGSLAKLGREVSVEARPISTGRTMTHVEVSGQVDGAESFTVRVAAGARPAHDADGQYVVPPPVKGPEGADPFDHPVHEGTWAARFEWRLAGRGDDGGGPWVAWWVRAREPTPALVAAAVLCDYVTYGVGRALGRPMGGLSIDNVLRIHRLSNPDPSEWLLLEVRPEALEAGFGYGTARLFAGDALLATGSQSMVMNNWDWRLPHEREPEATTPA